MIPAMKRVVAEFSGDDEWRVVRPPLTGLDDATATALLATLQHARFTLPGYPRPLERD